MKNKKFIYDEKTMKVYEYNPKTDTVRVATGFDLGKREIKILSDSI